MKFNLERNENKTVHLLCKCSLMDVCSITISGMCLTLFTQNESRKRDRKESEREAERCRLVLIGLTWNMKETVVGPVSEH